MANHDNQSKNEPRTLNDIPIQPGEELVKVFIGRDFTLDPNGEDMKNLHWGRIAKIWYRYAYVPVPKDMVEVAKQAFTSALNEMISEVLGPQRWARCLVPQPDGTLKPCNKDHAPKCSECPYHGKLGTEDRRTANIEYLLEHECMPGEPTYSEDSMLLGI